LIAAATTTDTQTNLMYKYVIVAQQPLWKLPCQGT
jgi:hypothetical protein